MSDPDIQAILGSKASWEEEDDDLNTDDFEDDEKEMDVEDLDEMDE